MAGLQAGSRGKLFDLIDEWYDSPDPAKEKAQLREILHALAYSAVVGEAGVNDDREAWREGYRGELERAARKEAKKQPQREASRGVRRSAALEAIARGTHPSLLED